MSDTQKVVHNVCTPARVEKKALELIDEGKYDELDMPMMKDLPLSVHHDILQEEILSIASKYQEINFKDMRHYVSKKCATMLKQLIYYGDNHADIG